MHNRTPWIIAGIAAGIVVLVLTGLTMVSALRDSGPLVSGKSVGLVEVEGVLTDSRRVVREIRRLSKESDIPVILLNVDSPGGVVTPAHEIYSELKQAQARGKKLVVSMGSVAASGAYYISAPADCIVANPSTIVGSIGVIMQFPQVEGLFKKLGLGVEVVKSRDFKDIGSPYRPMKPEERELLRDMVLDVYDQFVEVVVEGRKLSRDSVLELADGRVFSGRQAQKLGLVDSLGTLQDAIRIAGNLAGIKGEPRIVRLPRPFRLRDFLTEDLGNRLLMPRLEYIFR
jgi:protease-4